MIDQNMMCQLIISHMNWIILLIIDIYLTVSCGKSKNKNKTFVIQIYLILVRN